jgi:hypothetical protein
LHGLNISYNCEICGNFTYKGPKAFQRHFAEWRHAHGNVEVSLNLKVQQSDLLDSVS